ncbi:unnamed protein product [Schistosoma curassoni]|uniref:Ovule protein n=1 Tax=Schistosoma curassoni TaxID=6186 RepID=A0A183JLB7_9TREM|nr:unnamed protein product [Schistosoma curassoni]
MTKTYVHFFITSNFIFKQTGSLLFVFEYTRPSCEKYTKISPSNEPSLNLWDSYVYVIMGLFLQCK